MLRSNQPDIKSLTIREAHGGDIPVLERLFPEGTPDKHTVRVAKQLDNNAVYFLALQHGKPVGHVFLHMDGGQEKEVQEKISQCPSIEDLYVGRLYRSRGIGTRLLHECIKRVKEKGFHKIGLSVGITNVQVKQFYQQEGFSDSGIPQYWIEWEYIDRLTGEIKKEGEMCRYFIKSI